MTLFLLQQKKDNLTTPVKYVSSLEDGLLEIIKADGRTGVTVRIQPPNPHAAGGGMPPSWNVYVGEPVTKHFLLGAVPLRAVPLGRMTQ